MSHHIRGTRSDLIAFLVLSIWPSHFGLPLLLAIVLLSKKIQRHPTFINMCVTWIITGFSSSILYEFSFFLFIPPLLIFHAICLQTLCRKRNRSRTSKNALPCTGFSHARCTSNGYNGQFLSCNPGM